VYPNIELVVENEMLKNELNDIKKRLEVTMAKYLHNGNLTLSIRLAEQTEKRKILTPKENFEEMLENSKAFKYLAEKLKLELQ
jgi:DNA polymerase-3 subunit gamma/tau